MTQLAKRKAADAQLATLTRLERNLAQAVTVENHLDGHNEAEAFKECVKRAGLGLKMQNHAAEISLAHVRRGGTLLATMDRRGRGRHPKPDTVSDLETLDDLGIGYKQSSRWQLVAGVPDRKPVTLCYRFPRNPPERLLRPLTGFGQGLRCWHDEQQESHQ